MSVTPSVAATMSPSGSGSPRRAATPSVMATISPTGSVTPSPSVTASPTASPSISPTRTATPSSFLLLPKLAVGMSLLGGGEFTLRAAVASLTSVPGADATVSAVNTSYATVDVSYITSGASISTLRQVATLTTQAQTSTDPHAAA